MKRKFSIADYPLAETQPENVIGPRGKALSQVTLEAVIKGDVTMEDLRITPQALRAQAEISQAANRPTLAENFNRAAELVNVPQDFIMATYELLRPGRAKSKDELLAAVQTLRETYNAPAMAAFVEEAAEVYQQRGLFTFRF
jgi:propanediol dehydratase small subunit